MRQFISIILLLILPVLSFAAPNLFKSLAPGQWYVGASYGIAWLNASGNQTIKFDSLGNSTDTFDTSSRHQGSAYGIIGGYYIPRHTHWFPGYALEASYWQTSGLTAYGTHEITNPLNIDFNASYHYQYDVNVNAFSLGTAIDIIEWHQFIPFVGLGFDFATIKTQNYQETPQGTAVPTEMSFASSSTTKFLYYLRLGARYQFPKHWQVQLAYTYIPTVTINTGAGNTGVVAAPNLSDSLQLSRLGLAVSYQF